ncbi:MAG: arsenite methyltransferase [bacterium]
MADVRKTVRKAYARVATSRTSCCGPSGSCCSGAPEASANPVAEADLGLSCGDPLSFGHIRPGDVVLDLGCGAGKDVFIAAEIAGPDGRAIGVDMTPEMLELARENAKKLESRTGLSNVEFREAYIESLPVEDGSVDVVISNCVINLSPDKPQVFREIFRVLKPGGKMVVSDIVLNRPLPMSIASDLDAYAACIAGALMREEYLQAIQDSGLSEIEIASDRLYTAENACDDPLTKDISASLEGAASSVTIVARKHS